MKEEGNQLLNPHQLAALEHSLHQGSAEASEAFARWIGKPSLIELDALEQLPLEEATGLLAVGEEPICFCSAEITGPLSGELILAFDDASGLALSDMLLDEPQGTSPEWNEMAISAALETANILCCAYLNCLSRSFAKIGQGTALLPTPPKFSRDFAESLLQFALMGQATASDQVMVARTRFEIDAACVNWTLLFVPDYDSMSRLLKLLPPHDAEQ